mmetsp:Transcript_9374/g.23003  ORF Transcript_9374/g.23003 Transcript_9374/m.23003 type:complete len:450 (+) Transcript_9374:701-2050(+)
MLPAQRGEDVRRVQSGVFAQLPRDDLHGLRVGRHDQLLLPLDFQGALPKRIRHAHLDGPAAGDDGSRRDGPLDDHEGVVDAPLALGDELLGSSPQHDRAGQGRRALREEVEPLVADLALLEDPAGPEDRLGQAVAGRLDGSVGGLRDAFHVTVGDPSRAEQPTIGEVLRRQVTDRELREDDVGPAIDAGVELVVDDLPLRLHDGLVILRARDSNLGVFLFRLELQFHVEEQHLRVLELLGHLLESGVRKGLLEGDPLHQKGLADVSPGNLLDRDPFLELFDVPGLVELRDGGHDHRREEIPVGRDELAVERGAGALQQHLLPIGGDGERRDLVDSEPTRFAERLDHSRRRDALFDEGLELRQDLGRQKHHRGGPVSHRGVLAHRDVDEGLGRRVGDLEELHDRGSVVADGGPPAGGDELVHPPGTQRGSHGIGDGLAGVDVAHELRQSL